jgi:hypothetical protein
MKTAQARDRVVINNVARQTISFWLPQLPMQEFRIAIPELVSDAHAAILPWGFSSPQFEISDHVAGLSIKVPGAIQMQAEVSFRMEQIEAKIRATNLSSRKWEVANIFTCFNCGHSSLFRDPEAVRTYVATENGWKSVADVTTGLECSTPYTLVPITGGPELNDLWACRELKACRAPGACSGEMRIASVDGQWIARISTLHSAYLFNNRDLSCLHAAPCIEQLDPGASSELMNEIVIVRNTTD